MEIMNAASQPETPEVQTKRNGPAWRRFKTNIPLLIMFVPVILFYLIFRYAPIGGLVIAFKDYNFFDGIMGSPWVGFHYFEMLFQDARTLEIIRNTLVLSLLSLLFGFPIPIILAIMLNEVRSHFFKKTVQTIVYMPHFLSWVIIAMLVSTIFAMENGMVNRIVEALTAQPYPFM